jgi:glycosyltransferase involved in cell wall biosynthesis
VAWPTVAFDATPMAGFRTGIGVAVAESYAALAGLPEPPTLIAYTYGVRPVISGRGLPRRTRRLPVPTRGLLWSWARMGVPRLDWLHAPAQVMHATAFVAPPTRLPTLITIHDCAFARLPHAVARHVRTFDPILRRALARGAWVHCSTEAVASEVDDLFGPGLRRGGRMVVVPFAVPTLGRSRPVPQAVHRRLSDAPFILALSTLEPRKNLPRLIRAFGAIADDHGDLRLVLAGPDGPDRPAVEAAVDSLDGGARHRVLFAGVIGQGVRRALLERATVLAYPSLYEGFGFPMLEAMALGVPVVAGRAGGLPEVANGAAVLVDPEDQDAISAGLDRMLSDGERRGELARRGRERAAAFSWTRTAQGLAEAYRDLAGTRARTPS